MQLSYEFVKPVIEPIAAGKDFSKDGKAMAPEVAGVETASIRNRYWYVGINKKF